jgi:hypothetical protein
MDNPHSKTFIPTSFSVNAKDAANAHKIPRVLKGEELLFIIIYCHKNNIRTSLFATCK